jgi:hypothetical protein
MLPKKQLILCVLLLALLSYGTVFAKNTPDKVIIRGPGLSDELEITDSQTLEAFAMGMLLDYEKPIEEPQGLELGYKVTRYYRVGPNHLKDIDRFVYYPQANGRRSYIFYEGIIDKKFIYGGSPYDGKWFLATEEGDRAMLKILAANGIHPTQYGFTVYLPSEALTWLGYSGLVLVIGAILFFYYQNRATRRISV